MGFHRHEQPTVTLDRAAESRLRLKIDLMIVPTVALLYLFCFIDRANIGRCYTANAFSQDPWSLTNSSCP
jgi:hypothetical protein